MNMTSRQILNRRLPSLFGFFFLLLAIGTITWLSRNTILFGTRAAADNTPKDVRISNITDTSFTVSYITDANVLGSIKFGKFGNMDQVALDARDTTQATTKEHTTHYITMKNLAPATKYTFTITSGQENFSNNTVPYEVTTATTLPDLPSDSDFVETESTTLKGKVILDDGSAPDEALVYLTGPDTQLLSTIVQNDGSYTMNLLTMRNKELSAFVLFEPDDLLQMQLVNATKTSTISLLAMEMDPLPLITLSQNYDFAVSTEPLVSPVASGSATPSGTPPAFPTTEESTNTTPQIVTPKEEQEFKDQQPLFRGKAVPNETVTITINSEQTITATVTTDANGNWQYRPDVPLEPGTHTITMRTLDASGFMRVITQSFVVYAEGSQFTEPSVSPSASVTPSPTTLPTGTPTPTIKPTNTPVPTKAGTTPTATPSPTKTPTPTQQVISTTVSVSKTPIPVTGNTSLLIIVFSIVAAIGIGALLFVFTAV